MPRSRRADATLPPEHLPPFLFVSAHPAGTGELIAPYDRRRLSLSETYVTTMVAADLARRGLPPGTWWVRPQDGAVTPARIRPEQLDQRRRRHAVFNLRPVTP